MGGDCCLQHPTMQLNITDHLADALKEALNRAGLPVPESVFWEVPREESHGDYATNVAMTLARQARRAPEPGTARARRERARATGSSSSPRTPPGRS